MTKNSSAMFAVFAALLAGIFLGRITDSPVFVEPESTEATFADSIDLSLLEEVYKKTARYYYGFGEADAQDVRRGLAEGFVRSLGDKNSVLFSPEEAQNFDELISGDFEGVGAYINENESGVIIERLVAGAPAKKAGILPGDVILEVDGESTEGWGVFEVVKNIKGPAGTSVEITVFRPDDQERIHKITVVRERIDLPSVEYDIASELAHIQVFSFSENTPEQFDQALEDVISAGTKGIILDLRDNGGGLLESSVEMLSHFLPKELEIVKIRTQKGLEKAYNSTGKNLITLPMVVLVNENSASASEIVAGALQDHGRAIIIGNQTFGKGSVQRAFTLSDKSELKITTAHWFTPKDQQIEGQGVSPDQEVDFLYEDFAEGKDPQLDAAKNTLNQLLTASVEEVLNQNN